MKNNKPVSSSLTRYSPDDGSENPGGVLQPSHGTSAFNVCHSVWLLQQQSPQHGDSSFCDWHATLLSEVTGVGDFHQIWGIPD